MNHFPRALAGLCALLLMPAASAQTQTPSTAASAQNRVQVHTFPNAIRYTHHNDDFTVRVRTPGGIWQDLYEYKVKVDQDKKQDASMVAFNFDGTVEVAVQKNNGSFSKVAVRPGAKGIRTEVKDGIVYFTLQRPENLSVEFDDDRLHNLHLFTQAIRKDMPAVPAGLKPEDIGVGKAPDFTQKTVFFGPGIYADSDGSFRVRSNTTVYIHGSAILKSPLIIEGVENVKVISDGLFDSVSHIVTRNSRNVEFDGLIFINQPHGTMRCVMSQDLVEKNIRTIGAGPWSDGLGHFACQRVSISDSFIRTSDDCITLYNHRWDIWGDTRDVQVTNSTLWADVAHAVMIGLHGNTPSQSHPKAEVLERIRFTNIDILDHDEDDPVYQGAIGLLAGDDNTIRDVVFDDIRVERIEEGSLFTVKVANMPRWNTSAGLAIENVTLRNIHYTGKGLPNASLIEGADARRKVRNVTVENVTVNGKRLTGPDGNLVRVNEFTEGVRFK